MIKNKTIRNVVLVGAAALSLVVASQNAYAGGFLADTFIRPFSPSAADSADQWNKNAGQPVDHFANELAGDAANYVVPGSGVVVTGALEARMAAQNAGMFNGGGAPGGALGFQGQPQFAAQPLGAFCYVAGGRFGPGPIQPLGAPCNIMTAMGPVWGQVGS